jgi:hypothetical protein
MKQKINQIAAKNDFHSVSQEAEKPLKNGQISPWSKQIICRLTKLEISPIIPAAKNERKMT